MREAMRAGIAEQQKVQTAIAEFAAFVAIVPQPDIAGWRHPSKYLQRAEACLAAGYPRGADLFMNVARTPLKSTDSLVGAVQARERVRRRGHRPRLLAGIFAAFARHRR